MIRSKIVALRRMTNSEEDMEFYYRTSTEMLNVSNLTDHFLFVSFDEVKEDLQCSMNDEEDLTQIFCIMLGKTNVGLIYIIPDVEKRTAEIQVLLSDDRYRQIGIGFDAIYAATKYAKEELNLHSITFKIASHNTQMVNAFRISQYAYEKLSNDGKLGIEINEQVSKPDIIFRKEFNSCCNVSDFYSFTFLLDVNGFPFEEFLKLSSGKMSKYMNQEGKVYL